jgi:tetratricopeptide (TPR) repeat protein
MKNGTMFFILFILFSLIPGAAGLQTSADTAGQSGAVFLKLPAGGRNAGFGEAYTAVADDPYAISINPAGICRTRNLEISFSHTEWFQDVDLEYLGFSKSFFKGFGGMNSTLAASAHYLHVPDFMAYDDWGIALHPVRYAGWALSAAYAQEIGSLRAGVALKAVGESRDREADAAATMNIGLQYSYALPVIRIFKLALRDRILDLGATMDNWSMGMKVGGAGTPVNFKTGLAIRPVDPLLTSVDLQFPLDGRIRMNIGAEYGYRGFLFVRAGYRFWGVESDGVTMGVGASLKMSGKQIKADLAWVPQIGIGNTLIFSLSMRYPGRLAAEQRKLADLLYFKGIYYFTRGDYEKAIGVWQECLKIDPDFELAREKLDKAVRMDEIRKIEQEVERKLRSEERTGQNTGSRASKQIELN